MLDNTIKRYNNSILRLTIIIKRMIRFIEDVCEFDSPSKEYQSRWLELIDKEMEMGEREASFWKGKYKKF